MAFGFWPTRQHHTDDHSLTHSLTHSLAHSLTLTPSERTKSADCHTLTHAAPSNNSQPAEPPTDCALLHATNLQPPTSDLLWCMYDQGRGNSSTQSYYPLLQLQSRQPTADNLQTTNYKLQPTTDNLQLTIKGWSRAIAPCYNLQPRVIAILAYPLLQPLVEPFCQTINHRHQGPTPQFVR